MNTSLAAPAMLLTALFSVSANAVPIYVGPGEHADISSDVGDLVLESEASVSISDGAVIGNLDALSSNDISISGGTITRFIEASGGFHDTNISGGVFQLAGIDSTYLNITGGTFAGQGIVMQDAYGEISGGLFNGTSGGIGNSCYTPDPVGFCAHSDMRVTISGGIFDTAIGIATSPNNIIGQLSYGLVFEGYDLELTPVVLDGIMAHHLSGRLADGNIIDTDVYGIHDYQQQTFNSGVNQILFVQAPEPSTLALLGIGLVGMMRFGGRVKNRR